MFRLCLREQQDTTIAHTHTDVYIGAVILESVDNINHTTNRMTYLMKLGVFEVDRTIEASLPKG